MRCLGHSAGMAAAVDRGGAQPERSDLGVCGSIASSAAAPELRRAMEAQTTRIVPSVWCVYVSLSTAALDSSTVVGCPPSPLSFMDPHKKPSGEIFFAQSLVWLQPFLQISET